MNVYDKYPDKVQVDGKTYDLDLAWCNVLRAIDAEDDSELLAVDRLGLQCALLLRRGHRDVPETPAARVALLTAIFSLFKRDDEEKTTERYIDFHQDAALIRSAFFRMGVDLQTDRMHFCRFMELLADIPTDTALYRVMEIRQRPLPQPTKNNARQIAELQKAKARVAIRYSEEDRRRMFAEGLKNITALRG